MLIKDRPILLLMHVVNMSVLSTVRRLQFNSHTLTRSVSSAPRLPPLNESDLEESFVRSSGPGGQNVNKRETCVLLKHLPTGLVVKVQDERYQGQNRVIARRRLRELLDDHINGTNSIKQQKIEKFKRKQESKYEKSLLRLERIQLLKQQELVADSEEKDCVQSSTEDSKPASS